MEPILTTAAVTIALVIIQEKGDEAITAIFSSKDEPKEDEKSEPNTKK